MENLFHKGQQGEDLACQALVKRGYRIIDRHYTCRWGEIDIIALHQQTLVFVEVKTRTSNRLGFPEEAITAGKMTRLRKAIDFYLMQKGNINRPLRVDVVSVEKRSNAPPKITIFQNINIEQ